MQKPIAESCFRNQQAICDVLGGYFDESKTRLFEIGSGTGQHGVFIANQFKQLTWQPSDIESCLTGIDLWREETIHANVLPPVVLDVDQASLPDQLYDLAFTANTIHFVSETTGRNVITALANHTRSEGLCFIYGPFKDKGLFNSEGDMRLDSWLKSRDPESGIRDRQWVIELARQYGLTLLRTHDMPANNFILVFQKT